MIIFIKKEFNLNSILRYILGTSTIEGSGVHDWTINQLLHDILHHMWNLVKKLLRSLKQVKIESNFSSEDTEQFVYFDDFYQLVKHEPKIVIIKLILIEKDKLYNKIRNKSH